MRYLLPVCLALLLLCGPARAEERSIHRRPVLDAEVAAAFDAGDADALATLAARPDIDVWSTVERLGLAGRYEAALAYARLITAPLHAALPEYAAELQERGVSADLYAIMRKASAAGGPRKQLAELKGLEVPGDGVTQVGIWMLRGNAHFRLRRNAESAKAFGTAGEIARRIGWLEVGITAFNVGGRSAYFAGDWRHAVRLLRARLAIHEQMRDRGQAAGALANIGLIYYQQGRLSKAAGLMRRALSMKQKVGDEAGVARTQANLGAVLERMGDYAAALRQFESALAWFVSQGMAPQIAGLRTNIANVYSATGELEKARAVNEEALATLRRSGQPVEVARTASNLASLYLDLGLLAEAVPLLEEALGIFKAAGRLEGVITGTMSLAGVHAREGRLDEALAGYEEAIALAEGKGFRDRLPQLYLLKSEVLVTRGEVEAAMTEVDRAERAARSSRNQPWQVRAQVTRAGMLYQAERYEDALSVAREALSLSERQVGGLGEMGATAARARMRPLYQVGSRAAARLGRPDEAFLFLDSGRAGALLESLGGRDALRWAELPEDLLDARRAAEARVTQARQAYDQAAATGKRQLSREAAKRVAAAQDQLEAVVERIQREAKREAGLLYPRAITLGDLQDELRPNEAFISVDIYGDRVVRMSATTTTARVDDSLTTKAYFAADRLAFREKEGRIDGASLSALYALLTEGLDIPKSADTLILCAGGMLSYLPWSAMTDLRVCMTPSGTTHVLLREEDLVRGKGILGIGAPDYAGSAEGTRELRVRGKPLMPLPGTKVEIEAVADVQLTGAKATASGFAEAVRTRARWRAVHFACHGIIDPKRPMRSFLALTATDDDDGELTCLDIFRLEIPADLAVLSACETGRGKLAAAEGIVGMTRAFIYAGAPRVICSLWKVDDDATSALMTKFYELWNPRAEAGADSPAKPVKPMSAAEALRASQDHVRSQEKWSDPYFWAAWQLWGLPD